MTAAPSPSCWEAAGRLVATDGAVLPTRCVKCNGGDAVVMRRKTFDWKPAAFLVAGVGGAIVPARQSTLTFGVCRHHRRFTRIMIAASLGTLALGFGCIALAWRIGKPMGSLVGLAFILLAAVLWSFTAVLSPRSLDRTGATVYTGAGEPFLNALPTQARPSNRTAA